MKHRYEKYNVTTKLTLERSEIVEALSHDEALEIVGHETPQEIEGFNITSELFDTELVPEITAADIKRWTGDHASIVDLEMLLFDVATGATTQADIVQQIINERPDNT